MSSSAMSSSARRCLPRSVTGVRGQVDVVIRIHGGGLTGQADACKLGIARALKVMDPQLEPALRTEGLLTRDARMKERRSTVSAGHGAAPSSRNANRRQGRSARRHAVLVGRALEKPLGHRVVLRRDLGDHVFSSCSADLIVVAICEYSSQVPAPVSRTLRKQGFQVRAARLELGTHHHPWPLDLAGDGIQFAWTLRRSGLPAAA